MATTSGCKRVSTFNDKDISEMDSSSAEKFEDVALIVEGKRIKANSGILAFSSPVFASLLRSSAGGQEGRVMETERHINMLFPSPRYEFRSESSRAVQTTIGEPLMELVIPNYKYKDIKKTLSYLMDKNGKRTMSAETAWKILPISEEYKLKIVKKKCGEELLKSLTSLRQGKQEGTIPLKDVLKYLTCAEKYDFKKMKSFCIDECAANFEVSRRRDVADDKHLSEENKVKILEKMCDRMSLEYENKLEQIKAENDGRFKDVSRKLHQQKDVTENWKENTKQEVDAILKEAKAAHSKLVEDLKQKEIVSAIEEKVLQLSEDVLYEIGQVKEVLQTVEEAKDQLLKIAENMAAENENFKEPEDLDLLIRRCEKTLKAFRNSLEASGNNLEALANRFESQITTHLRRCNLDQIETSLAKNYDLQEAFDRLIADNTAKQRDLSNAEISFEKVRLDHEKTKDELRIYSIKISRVNTWIKWARPVDENEDKCLCTRHASLRSARQ